MNYSRSKKGFSYLAVILIPVFGFISGTAISSSFTLPAEARPDCNNMVCDWNEEETPPWHCDWNVDTKCNLYEQGNECGTDDTCNPVGM